ncbi:MAG: hypothetical protein ACLQAT_20810 [Candidatus Binataceae bacterium]
MKKPNQQNPLVLALAIVGVGALVYAGWHLYQRKVAEQEIRALFAAPPPPSIPDILHQKGGKNLPPQ